MSFLRCLFIDNTSYGISKKVNIYIYIYIHVYNIFIILYIYVYILYIYIYYIYIYIYIYIIRENVGFSYFINLINNHSQKIQDKMI